jgi:hypothetical protein
MLYTCVSLECCEERRPPFEQEGQGKPCPNCGFSNTLRRVACIHFLKRDPKGLLIGDKATFSVLCGTNLNRFKHGTGHESAVTCPDCLEILGATPNISIDDGSFITSKSDTRQDVPASSSHRKTKGQETVHEG